MKSRTVNDNGKIFVDLGAYDGDSIRLAQRHFGRFAEIHAFEPLPGPQQRMAREFGGSKRFHLVGAAAGVENSTARIFLGNQYGEIASSLFKGNRQCCDSEFVDIKVIDFPEYFKSKCSPRREKIVLKLNIEGGEYDILKVMADRNLLQSIDILFVDWHWSLIGLTEESHRDLVRRLRRHGFRLSGTKLDELSNALKYNAISLAVRKTFAFHYQGARLFLRNHAPAIFRILRRMKSILCSGKQ